MSDAETTVEDMPLPPAPLGGIREFDPDSVQLPWWVLLVGLFTGWIPAVFGLAGMRFLGFWQLHEWLVPVLVAMVTTGLVCFGAYVADRTLLRLPRAWRWAIGMGAGYALPLCEIPLFFAGSQVNVWGAIVGIALAMVVAGLSWALGGLLMGWACGKLSWLYVKLPLIGVLVGILGPFVTMTVDTYMSDSGSAIDNPATALARWLVGPAAGASLAYALTVARRQQEALTEQWNLGV